MCDVESFVYLKRGRIKRKFKGKSPPFFHSILIFNTFCSINSNINILYNNRISKSLVKICLTQYFGIWGIQFLVPFLIFLFQKKIYQTHRKRTDPITKKKLKIFSENKTSTKENILNIFQFDFDVRMEYIHQLLNIVVSAPS